MTISHEFRTPLITSLMLLNNIVVIPNLVSSTKETIWHVISQINMLLCLVNDQLDLQMIEQNKFVVNRRWDNKMMCDCVRKICFQKGEIWKSQECLV